MMRFAILLIIKTSCLAGYKALSSRSAVQSRSDLTNAIWDSTLTHETLGPTEFIAVHNNCRFFICGIFNLETNRAFPLLFFQGSIMRSMCVAFPSPSPPCPWGFQSPSKNESQEKQRSNQRKKTTIRKSNLLCASVKTMPVILAPFYYTPPRTSVGC
ncbi:hypothetical protein B0J13DRAFT_187692 [Dactylonectria estremocensis]|uniref:Secreted protein n=1 Tax=Dactylonectria estremocensis TaxID=1079267 RepID=A0A9P9FCG9_9HYPO|nr:hypothetical protein B0J13DRAFT_187692 [Dactylonectria estremocensis]